MIGSAFAKFPSTSSFTAVANSFAVRRGLEGAIHSLDGSSGKRA